VPLDLAERHPACIERDDLLIEAVEARLVLLDELRLELRSAVAGHVNAHLPALASQRLWRGAIARVAGVGAGGVVLLVAEVVGEFAVEGTLDESFGELLEQAVLAEHRI
jgi:hypothetical protein